MYTHHPLSSRSSDVPDWLRVIAGGFTTIVHRELMDDLTMVAFHWSEQVLVDLGGWTL